MQEYQIDLIWNLHRDAHQRLCRFVFKLFQMFESLHFKIDFSFRKGKKFLVTYIWIIGWLWKLFGVMYRIDFPAMTWKDQQGILVK